MTRYQYDRLYELKTTIQDATGNLEDLLAELRTGPFTQYRDEQCRAVERAIRHADNASAVLEEICT
jgi:hypothetical protein